MGCEGVAKQFSCVSFHKFICLWCSVRICPFPHPLVYMIFLFLVYLDAQSLCGCYHGQF